MHIQRNYRIYKGKDKTKVYTSVLLRQCYYEDKKIKQKTIANLSKVPEHIIRTIELAIKKDEVYYKIDELDFEDSFSYGHIACLNHIIKDIGLDKILYSKQTKRRDLAEAMIISRALYPKSELETTRWILEEEEFRGFYDIDYQKLRVDHLYETLDWLGKRQKKIETKLYETINEKPILFLYDITSTYFEGDKAELSAFRYNRDKKKEKRQIVVGLVLDKNGYPLSVEVFKGNTSDQSTLIPKIKTLKETYGLETGIIVGDRGMIKESNIKNTQENRFKYITALTHKKIEELIKNSSTPFQLGLFDERKLAEIWYNKRRYILCRSKERATEDNETLLGLIKKTKEKLDKIKESVEKGKLKNVDKIGIRVGRWKNRWKVGKYFEIEIKEGCFEYQINVDKIELAKELCGCYVITTSVPNDMMNSSEVVEYHKRLCLVDRAFKIIKKYLLHIQPIYHSKEIRIKAHAFLCMLAYYVVLELKKRLNELFLENSNGRNYKWTLEKIFRELRKIKLGYMEIKSIKIKQLKPLTIEQQKILRYLGVKLQVKKEIIH